MDTSLLEFVLGIVKVYNVFKKILDRKGVRSLMILKIMADLKPKYDRIQKYLDKIRNEFEKFILDEMYSCDEFEEIITNYTEILGDDFYDLIKGIIEVYNKDQKIFKSLVNDDYFYLIVDKWATVLKENKNATLGELLVSALDIAKTKYENEEEEEEEIDMDFLTEFQNKVERGELTKEEIQNKFNCIINNIQPKVLDALQFSEKDIRRAYVIFGIDEILKEVINEVFDEIERRVNDEPE